MQNTVALVVGAVIGAVLYLIPTIDALYRKHPRTGRIVLVNLLAGWTLLGWGIAFAWAEETGVPEAVPPAGAQIRKHAA